MSGQKKIDFRFYQELGDFLPAERRGRSFPIEVTGTPTIKDVIEGLGVPHAEVDLIVANGEPVGFDYHPVDGDRLAVYPMFESFDISPINRLRPEPLREPKFILDVHLGRLARLMRICGFDTRYDNDLDDGEIVAISVAETRTILTRDIGLLKRGAVVRGYWVRATDPYAQIVEVARRFDLAGRLSPFSRCPRCNGELDRAPAEEVTLRVPKRSREAFDEFYQCGSCSQIYWYGSHAEKLSEIIKKIRADT